jgi:hypothetical protein
MQHRRMTRPVRPHLLRLAAVLLLLSSGQSAARSDEMTGYMLLQVCTRMDAVSQNECDARLAAAYETAKAGIAVLEKQAGREPWRACVPATMDARLFRGFVLTYLAGRPDWRNLPLSSMVGRALMHAYPCG